MSAEDSTLKKSESREGPRAAYVEDGDEEEDDGNVGGGFQDWYTLRKDQEMDLGRGETGK